MVELIKLARIYKYNHQSAANAQRLVEVEILLTNILCFIFNLDYTPDFDFRSINKGALPVRSRQKVLKDLNVLEILMQMIHYPFKNNLYSEKSVHTLVYAKEIIQLCYSVIRGSIAGYRPNELYASQWLNLLIEYSLSGLDDSLGANSTLKELIDDNERILEAQIKKGTIDKFVYNLIDSRGDKKYVDILRAICICNGVPVAKNQRDLSEIILKDNATRKKLIPEHKLEGSEVLIRSPWAKETGIDWITFSNFKTESVRIDKGKYFSYYSALIYLLGDLCLGRNYIAIDGLQSFLPLATCVEAIISEEYSWSLRSAFCKLTTNLWIDVYPCMPMQFPENIKLWATIDSNNLNLKPVDEHQAKFSLLKTFILDFMTSVKQDCRNLLKTSDAEYAGFLVSVILMSRKMVTLGFFTDNSSFSKIFSALVEVLVATDELLIPGPQVTSAAGQESSRIDESTGLDEVCTDIKIKVCQLLQLFTEVKIDQRAGRLLGLYKQRVENQSSNKGSLSRSKSVRPPSSNQKQPETSNTLIKLEGEQLFENLFLQVVAEEKDGLIVRNEFLVGLLIRQTLFENKELKAISLDLLHTLYSETTYLSQRLGEIQVIEDEKQAKLLEECQEISQLLFSLTESRESWYSNKAHTELGQVKTLIRRQRALLGCHQSAADDQTIEDSDAKLPALVSDNSFLKVSLDRGYEGIDPFVQDLARNSQTLSQLCTLLRHSIESDVKMQNFMKQTSVVYQMLQLLAELAHSNPLNQKIIFDKIGSLVLVNLEKDSLSSNAVLLVQQLVRNNPSLLTVESQVTRITGVLFNRMLKETKRPMRVAYLLHTVQQLAMMDNHSLRANQSLIMSQLISNSMSPVFSPFRQASLVGNLKRECSSAPISFEYAGMKVKLVKADLCFFMAFMELVTICCFDKNPFAEKIAQSLVSLREVEEILRIDNISPLVEYEILKFIYHVYLDDEKESLAPSHFEGSDLTTHLLKICGKCLAQFEQSEAEGYLLTHKELVSTKVALYDLLRIALECFKKIIDIGRKSSHVVHSEDLELYTKISDTLRPFAATVQQEPMLREIVQPFVEHIGRKEGKAYFTKPSLNPDDEKEEDNEEQAARRQQLTVILRGSELNHQIQRLIDRMEQGRLQTVAFKKEFDHFKESATFDEMVATELSQMIVSNKTKDLSTYKILANFFESLVKFMDPEVGADTRTVKIGLKIIREYAGRHISQLGLSNSSRARSELSTTQDFLVGIGTTQLVCNLIVEQEDPQVIELALEVGAELLSEGNRRSQTEFKKALQGEQTSSKVLKKLEKVMLSSFEGLSRLMIAHNADQMRHIFFGEAAHSHLRFKGFSQFIGTHRKVFTFFKLLCEGHNSELQDFLREQRTNQEEKKTGINIDFVSHAVIMFGSFVKFFNNQCTEAGISLMDFLIESLQGPCKGNQDRVIKCKILDFCKDFINDLNGGSQDLISRGFDLHNKQHRSTTDTLFNKTIQLLLAVVEFNMEPEVVGYLGSNIEFRYLMQRLKSAYSDLVLSLKSNPLDANLIWRIKSKTFDPGVKLGFNIFFFIKMVDDITGAYSEKIIELGDLDSIAFNFFKENSGHLEVNFHGSIQKVYFMKHPSCNYLDAESQAELVTKVRRDSANEKIADFLAMAPSLFNLMDHTFEMTTKHKLRPAYLSHARTLALLVSYTINIYMFVYLTKTVDHGDTVDFTSSEFELSFSILGYAHLALSCLMVILQILLNNKLVRLSHWRNYLNRFSKEISQRRFRDDFDSRIVKSILEKDNFDITREELQIVIRQERRVGDESWAVPSLIYWTMNLKYFFSDGNLVYFMFYTLISSLAKFQSAWLFYGFGLFDIISKFDALQNVIKAITFNKKQLLLTVLLCTVIIYIYALFGYYYLIDSFWNSSFGEAGENQCTTVFHCFLTVFSLGPRSSGSVGDMMVRESYKPENRVKWYVRFFYDVSVFVIVNITGLNIIFGIIIDTFAALRDKRTKMVLNMTTVCFICSLDKMTYDKTSEGFEHHVTVDHNLWNYLYYIYFLKKENPNDFSGIHSYVANMLKKEDIFWFPIGKSLSLAQVSDQASTAQEKFGQLFERVKGLVESNKQLMTLRKKKKDALIENNSIPQTINVIPPN